MTAGDTVVVNNYISGLPKSLFGRITGFEDNGDPWVRTEAGKHLYKLSDVTENFGGPILACPACGETFNRHPLPIEDKNQS